MSLTNTDIIDSIECAVTATTATTNHSPRKLTSKAALVPDNLILDFAAGAGSSHYIAANAINAFYFALTQNPNPKVLIFFKQWALQFTEIHGTIVHKKFNPEAFFTSYGLKKDERSATDGFNFLAFFCALNTYYGLLIKLLAYRVVAYYTLNDCPLAVWEKSDAAALKEKLANLETGGIFRALGIRNFLEGDLLSWYLHDWNDPMAQAIRIIIERLNRYDPETMALIPDQTRDIFKKLYQFLVPRQIRHDLGEYYTPDWLAEHCLNQVGYGVNERELLQKRVLDPGCGSGTFLVLAIKRAKEHAQRKNINPAETLTQITKNIVGFDLNPLAVIAARTNYLLAIADLLKHKKEEITIPIYLCDSINPPQIQIIGEVPRLAENMVEKTGAKLIHADEKHQQSEVNGTNCLCPWIIKDACAPLFMGQFDMVVGNPPWVNWESLPQEYREKTAHLWQKYDLFEHSGLRARLGSAKDDISVLMTYVAMDRYVRDNGRLCFVITQTLFKTADGGKGFRRFRLGRNGTPFKVLHVDDMSALQPFDSATNRTAVLVCQKGEPTTFPVTYHLWKKKVKGAIELDLNLAEVLQRIDVKHLHAQSINGSEQGSWISVNDGALNLLQKVIGEAAYQAREGTNTGGANGVYWVSVDDRQQNLVKVANRWNIGKRKVPAVTLEIEDEFLYPLLRGRDIERWSASPSCNILLPYRSDSPVNGYAENSMKEKFFRTYNYFDEHFRDSLAARKSSSVPQNPFYSMYGVGPYTFAPYKVVWSEVGHRVEAAVVASFECNFIGKKVIVPDHTVVAISLDEVSEAHFVCAMLNSSPAQFIVVGYVVLHPSPHILKNIKIPKYDSQNKTHQDLADLSRQCHKKVAASISVTEIEEHIDMLAAELWGLSKDELTDIKESVEEMR